MIVCAIIVIIDVIAFTTTGRDSKSFMAKGILPCRSRSGYSDLNRLLIEIDST